MAKIPTPSRLAVMADFLRYDIYDRAIAYYRKRCGKKAAEAADRFRFAVRDERLFLTLLQHDDSEVAKYEVCPVGEGLKFKLRHIESGTEDVTHE